jgi:hypothetical protein
MESLKFHLGSPCHALIRPTGGPPLKRLYGRFRGGLPVGMACPQGRVFYPLKHATPYAYASQGFDTSVKTVPHTGPTNQEYDQLLVELKNLKMIVMGHERRIRNMEFKLGEKEREHDHIKSQRQKDSDAKQKQ